MKKLLLILISIITISITTGLVITGCKKKSVNEPTLSYFAKNNWNSSKWFWKEMCRTNKESVYMLDSVVFGGTGIYINTKENDADALWFAVDAITVLEDLDGLPGPIPPEPRKRDTIPYAPRHTDIVLEAPRLHAGDTIKLFYSITDSVLNAFILGQSTKVDN